MDRTPGRPLLFVALVLTLWVSGRSMIDSDAQVSETFAALPPARLADVSNAKPSIGVPARASAIHIASQPSPSTFLNQFAVSANRPVIAPSLSPVALPWAAGGQPSGSSPLPRVAADESPTGLRGTTPQTFAPEKKAGTNLRLPAIVSEPPPRPEEKRQRLSLYAYSFWRENSALASSALAPSPQYGGSQSGIIATWDPFGTAQKGPAVLLRASFTPDGQEREVAVGVRWKPAQAIPLSLSIERRFRAHMADRFAAYVAGGASDVRITGPLFFDAFGQVGIVTGRGGGRFFDGQAKITAPVTEIGDALVGLGAGTWAGGQHGAARLDIGPVLASNLQLGEANARIELNWRFRAAGKAAPGSGPSLTLSGGF